MFTLRIVFWGLIALVPHPDPQDGVTALVLNPRRPFHLPIVGLVEGTCTGDCYRFGPIDLATCGDEGCCRDCGFPFVTCSDDACCKADDCVPFERGPWQLLWFSWDEDLKLHNLWDEDLKLHKLDATEFSILENVRKNKDYPRDSCESADLSWVPHIEKLAWGNAEDIFEDCVDGASPVGCPSVQARFRLENGQLSACHMLHDGEGMRIFEFERLGAGGNIGGYRQALADAVMIEMQVTGDYIDLEADFFDSNMSRVAKIKPVEYGVGEDGQSLRRATILVASIGANPDHSHFRHFFDLAKNPRTQIYRSRPTAVENLEEHVEGSCEGVLKAYDTFVAATVGKIISSVSGGLGRESSPGSVGAFLSLGGRAMTAYPHNAAECDMVIYDR